MVFSNTVFLFLFLPIVIILYYVCPKTSVRNIILTAASVLFYAYGEPFAVFLMLISVAVNYLFGIFMDEKYRLRKLLLIISVIWNLAVLGIYKYADFAVEILNAVMPFELQEPNIALPIGISFFTFQVMSYVIDVYKQPEMIQKNPVKLLFYISFFPQLIAGPIIKYHDFEYQINSRSITPERTAQGVRRFIFGLSKKVLISNQMALVADGIYALDENLLSAPTAWLGAVCYMLQIYYDFSGYSDMAIGLGKIFGFDFKENFNYPYSSVSVTDFWRRWHLSLSTWFKEYLYIPLGGNRKGKVRTYINKLIVFLLTGLWHGASVNFVIWGLLNGAALTFESMTGLFKEKKHKIAGRIYTLIFVCLAFVVFRAESFGQSVLFYREMFTGFDITHASLVATLEYVTPVFITVFVFAVVFSVPIKNVLSDTRLKKYSSAVQTAGYAVSMLLLLLCIISLSASTYNPFIYFRF